MAEELTQSKEKWIWRRKGAYKILELAKQGKSAREIAEVVKWREETVWHFMSSPTFLQKLEDYLKCVFFNFQKNKILALEEVSKLFWDVATGKKQVEGFSAEQAARHLVSILGLREKEPKLINPKQYNLIVNIFKTEPKSSLDLAKEFGFADLLPEGGESGSSPE